jgi:hypothetical protein
MPGFQVNVLLDIDRFEAAITDWGEQTRIENSLAAVDCAEFIKELVQLKLMEFPHPPGTETDAPPYKGPVGFISGHLHDSVSVTVMPIAGFTKVGVSAVYARIQELGGWAGTDHMSYMPPRPYFRPVVMEIETAGEGQHIFYQHWRDAMMRAVLF